MKKTSQYPIGTAGKPWGPAEKAQWLAKQSVKRSYHDDVVVAIEQLMGAQLAGGVTCHQYGELDYQAQGAQCYPLLALTSAKFDNAKPTALITGGVHGYETSGVHGALQFLARHGQDYAAQFNLLVAPCISPWGYETINRWNVFAVDPNRSFTAGAHDAPEASQLMSFVAQICEQEGVQVDVHIDLHETTDTDNSEFRPALAARDGKVNTNWNIPDGFYLVANSAQPEDDFQRAVNEAVAKVTHIAEADENGRLIGVPISQTGVIGYDAKPLGLCMGLSNAPYVTTTEVYPDSQNTSAAECIDAQVAAVCGALSFVAEQVG